MRKFIAALSLLSTTALVSPAAFAKAKTVSEPKSPVATVKAKTANHSVKREMPVRGPHGRFLPRKIR